MGQKGFIPILITLAIILVIGITLGAYSLGTLKSSKPQTINPVVTSETIASPSPIIINATSLPSSPLLTSSNPGSKIGKGAANIQLAYPDKTDLTNRTVKANVDYDIQFVTQIINKLPIVGSPLISLSAQERYGYGVGARTVNGSSLGTYNKTINQLFLNMEQGSKDPVLTEHLILHEMAHYLSIKYNSQNLLPYLSQAAADQITKAENQLIDEIRTYDKNANPEASDTLFAKLNSKTPITWQEIVNAANTYPADIWQNPHNYLQFSETQNIDINEVKTRADSELYAEFTSFLLQAQNANLYDKSYQHPAYKIFSDLKAGLIQ